jgi:CheY-like chemotaxis protein
VTSREGVGTTFRVVVPAEPAEDETDDERAIDSSRGRILIVDDRAEIIDALSSVADELGFECDRATSAAVAANLLASRAYDCVLLDVEMPITGGADLADTARAGKGPNAGSRFIGMSAGEVGAAAQRRFDAWLSKPIDLNALRQALLGPGQGARPSQPGLWLESHG